MTEAERSIRSWLKGRQDLGEPEWFVPQGERRRILETLRSAGREVRPSASGADTEELARTATREQILALEDMTSLRTVAEKCTRCELHRTRTHVVFADGAADARLMCVGEAPGANEDRTGLPFVGRAGKLLDRLLLSVGFPREQVFICNVLKCRPPGNRNPLPAEIETCSPFLLRQVELVRPTVIVAFGTFAAQTLLGVKDSLRHMRGRTHMYRGFPLVVTYHPAALLRNPGWTRPTWRDLQLARKLVDGDGGSITPQRSVEPSSTDETGTPDEEEVRGDQLILGGDDG